MKRKTPIFVLIGLIATTVFLACEGPELFHSSESSSWNIPVWNNKGKDKDAIAEARSWYNLHRDEVNTIATRTDGYRLFGDMEPLWKQTYTRKTEEFTSIESGLKTSRGIFFVSPDCQAKYKETNDKRYLVTMTRLIMLKYTDKRPMIGFFMTLSPSAKYLEMTKFRPFYSTYAQREKAYDGYVYYHDMQGNFVNGWKYTKGKVVQALRPKSTLSTRATILVCTPIYEYQCEYPEGFVNEEGEPTITANCDYVYVGDDCYTTTDNNTETEENPDIGNGSGDSGNGGGGLGGGGNNGSYQPDNNNPTRPEVPKKKLPSFSELSTKFNEVAKMSSPDVYKKIGGLVYVNYVQNPVDFGNACVLRLSYAFNMIAGHIILQAGNKTISGDVNSDGKKEWYYFRIPDIADYLNYTYGNCKQMTREQIQGKKGIIKLTGCDWRDAYGHIDIWDGSNFLNSDFPVCKIVHFWEIQ